MTKIKKTSALFFAAFVATLLVSCFGGDGDKFRDVTDLFKNTGNIYEEIVHHDDGSITYYAKAWGGLIAEFNSSEGPADWSPYASIVFEFAKPTNTYMQIEVNGKLMSWTGKESSSIEATFGGKDLSAVKNVALRPWDSTTVDIQRIYLTDALPPKYSTTIWDGECKMGNWTNGFVITPDKFETANAGDELEFIYDSDTSVPTVTYWQLKTIYNGTDITLEGNKHDLNDWGCILVSHELHSYRITLTARDVEQLKKLGLFVNGYYTIVTQCNLLQ